MNLALFDFDGTISGRDSFLHFLWSLDRTRLLSTLVFVSPAIILFWLRRLEADRSKELFLTRMVAGLRGDESDFAAKRLRPLLVRESDPFSARLQLLLQMCRRRSILNIAYDCPNREIS